MTWNHIVIGHDSSEFGASRLEKIALGRDFSVSRRPFGRAELEGTLFLRLICAAGVLLSIVIEESRCQQGNHDLVMANERIPFP